MLRLMEKIGRRKIALVLFLLVVGYTLLPLIPFWIMKGAPAEENNASAIQRLKENKGQYFSFIVFGDSHSGVIFNDAATLKEVWHMNREDRFQKVPVDFVLGLGDLTLDGKRSHYIASKKIQKLIKYPLISAIGNHDAPALFSEFYGDREFVFVNRNSFFIVLDNVTGELNEGQFAWLEEQLREGEKYDNTFIVMHKPPFDPYQQDWYNEDNSTWAYRFRKLCGEYGVDMVFAGHKHMFKHERFDGVDYIVSGGGGMVMEIPEHEGGYLHYVRVMVNNDYVTYEVRKVSPPLWEYLTYYFWKEAVYWVRNYYGTGYIFGKNAKIEPLRNDRVNDEEYWLWR